MNIHESIITNDKQILYGSDPPLSIIEVSLALIVEETMEWRWIGKLGDLLC